MIFRKISLLVFCFGASYGTTVRASAEDSSSAWGFSVSTTYGFLIAHRDALLPLQEEHLFSIEASLFKSTSGTREWERSYLLPEKGLHAAWIRPGSHFKLGNAVTVFPYLDFPLSKKPGRHLWFRYGMGLGFVQHVFDPEENYRNVAIGSHLNGVIHFGFSYRTFSEGRSSMDIGLQLTHFSNGSIRMPNLGINLPAAFLAYRFGGTNRTGRSTEIETPNPTKGLLSIMASFSIKQVYPAEGPFYQAATVSATRFFSSRKKNQWGVGGDVFYDNSLSVRNGKLNGDSSKASDFRPGIHGAWKLDIDRLSLLFNMGFYPYTAFKGDGNFYHRIGLRYNFGRVFACMQLKTHYARADFIEWGIGYNISKIK